MKYMLLFCGSDEDRRAFEAMSEEELRARYAEVARWFGAHEQRIVATARLQPREAATTVRFPPEGEPLSAAEVATISRWIDEGLKWEAGFSFGPQAYEPPLKPRMPDLPPPVGGRPVVRPVLFPRR